MKLRTIHRILIRLMLASAAAVPLTGCERPEPKTVAWKLESVGGPLDVRPMPPPSQVASDYESWIKSGDGPRVLVYEVTLTNAASQVNYTHRIDRSDSPLGRPWITIVSFQYVFATNEVATFHVSGSGKKDTTFMRVGDKPLKIFVTPVKPRNPLIPELGIVAVEGVTRGPIPASPTGVP